MFQYFAPATWINICFSARPIIRPFGTRHIVPVFPLMKTVPGIMPHEKHTIEFYVRWFEIIFCTWLSVDTDGWKNCPSTRLSDGSVPPLRTRRPHPLNNNGENGKNRGSLSQGSFGMRYANTGELMAFDINAIPSPTLSSVQRGHKKKFEYEYQPQLDLRHECAECV